MFKNRVRTYQSAVTSLRRVIQIHAMAFEIIHPLFTIDAGIVVGIPLSHRHNPSESNTRIRYSAM